MKYLKKGFLVYEMGYERGSAIKHLTLILGLAGVTEVKRSDGDWFVPQYLINAGIYLAAHQCSQYQTVSSRTIAVTVSPFSRPLTAFTKWVYIASLLCQPTPCQKLRWEGSTSLKLNSTFWRALCIPATSSCARTRV